MVTIRVGGVPEHFNLPWHLGIENEIFSREGINVKWTTFKGGTGQMAQALRADEVDLCVVLTEGIIADIASGNPSKIISKYLNTPLIWGIFSGIENPIQYYGEIYTKRYAISRLGSGSHLMPIIDAKNNNKSLEPNQFVIVKDLAGALASLAALETDVFYWEKYTTKPHVDSGQLKCIGEFVTPWPCFVLAASNKAIKSKRKSLKQLLNTLYFINKQFMSSLDTVELVSKRYHQNPLDVNNWFHSTEWSTNDEISQKIIENVVFSLKQCGVLQHSIKPNSLCVKI